MECASVPSHISLKFNRNVTFCDFNASIAIITDMKYALHGCVGSFNLWNVCGPLAYESVWKQPLFFSRDSWIIRFCSYLYEFFTSLQDFIPICPRIHWNVEYFCVCLGGDDRKYSHIPRVYTLGHMVLCENYSLNNEVSRIRHLSMKPPYKQHSWDTFFLKKIIINPFIHHSVPLVTDLLETCVDEVLRVSVTMVTPEEVGAIGTHTSTVAEETLSLTGELIYANTVRRWAS